MIRLYRRFQAWRWRRAHPPCVIICYAGEATERPQVHVSAAGNGGSQGVYTWDKNDQGEASATLYGTGLAQIFNVPLIDQRDPKWPR